jgi:hypothetical protein
MLQLVLSLSRQKQYNANYKFKMTHHDNIFIYCHYKTKKYECKNKAYILYNNLFLN